MFLCVVIEVFVGKGDIFFEIWLKIEEKCYYFFRIKILRIFVLVFFVMYSYFVVFIIF